MAVRHARDVVGVVVAGGSSARFGGDVPKQYLPLDGETVLARSVRALSTHPAIRGVVVVLPPEDVQGKHGETVRRMTGVLDVVAGGPTRAHSSRNGVAASGPAEFVLVHDAARPWVDPGVIDRVASATLEHGAAVPVVPVRDTVKVRGEDGFVEETLDRGHILAAQTPQGSRGDWLVAALDAALGAGVDVTDEAAALERTGHRVRLVEGDPANTKITTRADLEEKTMGTETNLRIGHGFDVHRFEEGRPLVLGGTLFPGETGLAGHSDADVVLHAAMDALLGAAALGDIGAHFPPDDPGFEDADSKDLARLVAKLLAGRDCQVVNLDLTLQAERPKIRDRVAEMRETIASCFGVPVERVALKATTLEGMGPLGRGEGIGCHAVALLSVKDSPS